MRPSSHQAGPGWRIAQKADRVAAMLFTHCTKDCWTPVQTVRQPGTRVQVDGAMMGSTTRIAAARAREDGRKGIDQGRVPHRCRRGPWRSGRSGRGWRCAPGGFNWSRWASSLRPRESALVMADQRESARGVDVDGLEGLGPRPGSHRCYERHGPLHNGSAAVSGWCSSCRVKPMSASRKGDGLQHFP